MTNRTLKTALYAAGAVTLALSVTTASSAQFRQNQQSSNPLGDLIGMIANASAKSKAKKRWAQVAPEVHQCVNTMFASRNVKVEQFIAAGMSPTDANMAPIIELCQTVMTAQLKTNFACNVANAKGQQVQTTCSQSFAKAVNGKWAPVSRDDFLRAAANDEQVTVTDFETAAANTARLAEEKRLAQEAAAREEAARRERLEKEEEERRRFAASPEGKRQAAQRLAEREAQERRFEQQRRQRPRGYKITCNGVASNSYYVEDPDKLNAKLINCNDPKSVKDAMWWAVNRMRLESDSARYTVYARHCSESIARYSEYNVRGRMVQDGGFLNACNVGLSGVNGPSLEEAKGAKR
jgi:hypothetical protein